MTFRKLAAACLLALPLASMACADDTESDLNNFSSNQATLLNFTFEGELEATSAWNPERLVEDQMLYTIGHLNHDNAVGRLDLLEVEILDRSELANGNTSIKYRATIPVGWGSKTNLPETYELTLPRHADTTGFAAFTDKYKNDCVDWGAHDVDAGSMWYYYRPQKSRCNLAPEDVVVTQATVTVNETNTSGRYPEYHKVWEDDALSVLAIFGKYEDGANSNSDAGISAYNNFVRELKRHYPEVVTTPESVSNSPGVGTPDITFNATLADGRTLSVTALLVDNVRTAGPTFNARYEGLSGDADMIVYNGHAGLGANIRALASKGKFVTGKYQIFFMNGCDTFAYVDDQLADAKSALNEDDPTGTRYLDMVTNIMPSFFRSMPNASMAMINGLLSYDAPMTYDKIFEGIDRSEVVVVTGEEDNVFEPGGVVTSDWTGITEEGSVGRGEEVVLELGELPAGSYTFAITGDDGGDVDLYLATGRTPTASDYDERPYLDGSDESVTLSLDTPQTVTLMLRGYDQAGIERSAYSLVGKSIQ